MYIYLLPFIAALALGAGTIIQKEVLKKNADIKKYQVLEFLGIVIVMIPLLFFFWKISPEALELKNVLIFLGVIVLSIIANLLGFYAVRGEKVNNLEPARMMDPLFVVLLAIVFSFVNPILYERDFSVIIPALIAGSALIFSHIKKHHLKFNKYFRATIYASFLFALEMVISKLILDYYNPITFYFLRCFGVLLISWLIFRPNLKIESKKTNLKILLIGASWVIYRVLTYYGYIKIGVVLTTLILMLGPVFIYIFARIFLKEKISWKNIAASAVILLCLLYVLLF